MGAASLTAAEAAEDAAAVAAEGFVTGGVVAEEAGSTGPQVVSAGGESDAAANSKALMRTPKLQQTGVFCGSFFSFCSC